MPGSDGRRQRAAAAAGRELGGGVSDQRRRPVFSWLDGCRPDGRTLTATLLLLCLRVSDDCLSVAGASAPESSLARGGQCPLSNCWERFQTDFLSHFDDHNHSPDSSTCFESVISSPDAPDLQAPPFYDDPEVDDDPASFRYFHPEDRPALKSSDHGRGFRLPGGEVRRRRWADEAELNRRKLCDALRSLAECIDAADAACRGILTYHSSRRLARSRMTRCNCSRNATSESVDDRQRQELNATDVDRREKWSDEQSLEIGNSSSCRYAEPPASSLCVVYGDPHVRTFDGRFQTCRVLGTWPLVDNEYLTVQITNSHMGWGNGTAVSKVAVIVKHYGDCAAPDGQHLTYFADEGRLPSTWNDDLVNTGTAPLKGVEIFEAVPAERVDIYLLYAATVVSLRLVGRYYTVSVILPSSLATRTDDSQRNSTSDLAAVQLCRTGCPSSETVDLRAFFRQTARRQVKAKRTTSVWGSKYGRGGTAVLPLPVAIQKCGETVGLSGYLTDSCIFDLLNTGDLSFAQLSAKGALADVRGVFDGSDLTAALKNDSIGAMVAERLKSEPEAEVTSSRAASLRPTVTRCRWLIVSQLFVAVILALRTAL